MHIRPIHHGDAARLAVLLDQLGFPSAEREVRQRLDYWLGDRAGALLGADDDGTLVGMAALHITPLLEVTGKFGRLAALVVDEAVRGRGVGRMLILAAEERARAAGCLYVEVNSSNHRESAHLFYESLGFTDSRETSRRFVRPLQGT
ncbi:GNAT family N-acetyltransferase [Actinoplanes sichuanensis]|uniref:GNAT family N-acetyltransferase n=1 Tax=Actinoplanes sichuanensis TaxID=512349 RepID=A0ABW4ARA6_9ACTN|nr:GNAT family N-acetyltransferase [Actinoplanes sichuanensis]BEL04839.1 GNAT family N-acetyltransferase [Actinoplanes sichuanensis]